MGRSIVFAIVMVYMQIENLYTLIDIFVMKAQPIELFPFSQGKTEIDFIVNCYKTDLGLWQGKSRMRQPRQGLNIWRRICDGLQDQSIRFANNLFP
jgi:hypothetical protein